MKRTKEEAAETRRLILDSALKIFSQKGYAVARLEDVAEDAGVTRGAIYWHFENKYKLYCELFEKFSSKILNRLDEILKTDLTPLSKIQQIMREIFVCIEEDKEYRAIEEMSLFKTELTDELKGIFQEHSRCIHFVSEALKQLIREGIAAGEVNAGIDPDITAMAIVSYIGGVKSTWLMDRTAFSPKRCADSLIQIFFSGIARKN